MSGLKQKLIIQWESWSKRRNPQGNPQRLDSKNLYIIPSAFGWIFALMLLTLISGAINYQISSIFLMSFLLGTIGLISAWEAHANLKGLSLKLISINDAQRGKPAQINFMIHTQNKMRFGIEFKIASQTTIRLEKIPIEGMQFIFPIQTSKRGCFILPPIVISSLFPFGLFKVWGYAYFDAHYYVYPEPVSPNFWPIPSMQSLSPKHVSSPGDDEFYDLKQVDNPWAQPNLIAWKIAAKGQGWYLKTREAATGEHWLFSLKDLPVKELELQLEHLSYWLHTAEENGHIYGLELGNSPIHLAQGEEHLLHCLRQLAEY